MEGHPCLAGAWLPYGLGTLFSSEIWLSPVTVFSCPFPLAAQFSFLPTHVHGKPVPLSDVFWDTRSLGPAALPSCCVSQACTHAHTHTLLLDAPTPLPCCPPALGVGLPLFLDGQLPWVSSWAWCCGTQVGRVRGGGTNWRDIRTAGGASGRLKVRCSHGL